MAGWPVTNHWSVASTGPALSNDWIFPPNSRALLPTFRPDGSHFAQMGSHFVQNTTTNPCSLLSHHKPLGGICRYLKHPQLHPKTPHFLAWTWKWAKWTTVCAKWTPTGQNVWKVDKPFLDKTFPRPPSHLGSDHTRPMHIAQSFDWRSTLEVTESQHSGPRSKLCSGGQGSGESAGAFSEAALKLANWHKVSGCPASLSHSGCASLSWQCQSLELFTARPYSCSSSSYDRQFAWPLVCVGTVLRVRVQPKRFDTEGGPGGPGGDNPRRRECCGPDRTHMLPPRPQQRESQRHWLLGGWHYDYSQDRGLHASAHHESPAAVAKADASETSWGVGVQVLHTSWSTSSIRVSRALTTSDSDFNVFCSARPPACGSHRFLKVHNPQIWTSEHHLGLVAQLGAR